MPGGLVPRDPEATTRTRRALSQVGDILNSLIISGDIVMVGPGQWSLSDSVKRQTPTIVYEEHYGDDVIVPGPTGRDGRDGAGGPGLGFLVEDGQPGEQGFPGRDGPTGQTGSTGQPGAAVFMFGEDGNEGDQGRTGQDGQAGATGQTGQTGAAGPALFFTATDGEPGETGPPGRDGATGSTGQTGSQGSIGPAFIGQDGEDGERGFPGQQGLQGIQGPIGPPAFVFDELQAEPFMIPPGFSQYAFVKAGAAHATGLVPDPSATAKPNDWFILGDDGLWHSNSSVYASSFVSTFESTTSTTPTDLATVMSVTFTVDVSTDFYVYVSCTGFSSTALQAAIVSINVDGATSSAASFASATSNQSAVISATKKFTLAAGSHTIKMYFSSSLAASTAGFIDRTMIIYK